MVVFTYNVNLTHLPSPPYPHPAFAVMLIITNLAPVIAKFLLNPLRIFFFNTGLQKTNNTNMLTVKVVLNFLDFIGVI